MDAAVTGSQSTEHEAVSPPRKSSTYLLLDACRGFAALWVVMVHSSFATILTTYPNLIHYPLYKFSIYGRLGVVMFFVISGYCITAAMVNAAAKPDPIRRFLLARVKRIFPPYYCSTILAILIAAFVAVLVAHRLMPEPHHIIKPWQNHSFRFWFAAITLTQMPLHVTPIIDVYWSLCFEITFYVITALLFAIFRKNLLLALNLFTLLTLAWLLISPTTVPFPLSLWYLFGLGAMAYTYIVDEKNRKSILPIFLVTIAATAICALVHPGVSTEGHPSQRIEMLFGCVFTAAIVALHRFDAQISGQLVVRWFRNVGFFSYSLYLAHPMILWIPWQLSKRLGLAKGTCLIPFFAQVIAGVIWGYLFFLLFEKPWLSTRAKQREKTVSV